MLNIVGNQIEQYKLKQKKTKITDPEKIHAKTAA